VPIEENPLNEYILSGGIVPVHKISLYTNPAPDMDYLD
jgi:hypothetical protein